jgi:hypothetical protein
MPRLVPATDGAPMHSDGMRTGETPVLRFVATDGAPNNERFRNREFAFLVLLAACLPVRVSRITTLAGKPPVAPEKPPVAPEKPPVAPEKPPVAPCSRFGNHF